MSLNLSLPQDALAWLTEEGFAEMGDTGWARIIKAPQHSKGPTLDKVRREELRDLHSFVRCIKTLGAWTVSTATGGEPRVEMSRGVDGDEILFRLRKP